MEYLQFRIEDFLQAARQPVGAKVVIEAEAVEQGPGEAEARRVASVRLEAERTPTHVRMRELRQHEGR